MAPKAQQIEAEYHLLDFSPPLHPLPRQAFELGLGMPTFNNAITAPLGLALSAPSRPTSAAASVSSPPSVSSPSVTSPSTSSTALVVAPLRKRVAKSWGWSEEEDAVLRRCKGGPKEAWTAIAAETLAREVPMPLGEAPRTAKQCRSRWTTIKPVESDHARSMSIDSDSLAKGAS